MKITLDALELLDAIDTRGSFAAAAEALFRVPSALTHAVRRLEDELGVTLFVRQGRRAVLTPAGRMLLDEGRHLLRAAGDLECRVRRVATGWESELRVAVDVLIDPARLLPLLTDFYAANGGTRLRLSAEVLGGGWDALYTGRADLAIGVSGDAPPGGGFRSMPLGTARFVFAVAPGHPLAGAAEPIMPDTLQAHRAAALADTSRQLLARTAGLVSGQDVLTVPDVATKLAAQVAGLGVGYIADWLAAPEIAAGRLVAKRVAEERPEVTLLTAWRASHTGRALAWFVERLGDEALGRALLPTPITAAEKPARRSRGQPHRHLVAEDAP